MSEPTVFDQIAAIAEIGPEYEAQMAALSDKLERIERRMRSLPAMMFFEVSMAIGLLRWERYCGMWRLMVRRQDDGLFYPVCTASAPLKVRAACLLPGLLHEMQYQMRAIGAAAEAAVQGLPE